MSRRLHGAPLALACDGTVLLNLARFDDVTTMDEVVALAKEQPGTVFIGVALSPSEVRRLRDGSSLHDACAHAIGRRQRRMKAGK
jgi:hypothetical protein